MGRNIPVVPTARFKSSLAFWPKSGSSPYFDTLISCSTLSLACRRMRSTSPPSKVIGRFPRWWPTIPEVCISYTSINCGKRTLSSTLNSLRSPSCVCKSQTSQRDPETCEFRENNTKNVYMQSTGVLKAKQGRDRSDASRCRNWSRDRFGSFLACHLGEICLR